MKKWMILALMIFMSCFAFAQNGGPRACIGFLVGGEDIDDEMNGGLHSAFGWQLDIPYSSKDFTGYGEGGIMLLGIEHGIFFPHVWGYFGIRNDEIGFGIGPVFSPLGLGLGINPYYQIQADKLRIPIGFNLDLIGSAQRYQLSVGFMYR